jgi:HPr kinase/phosphorylase
MSETFCSITEFANHFELKPIFASTNSLSKSIKVIEVDRPGLEMTGFFDYHQKKRLVLLGKKEVAYLEKMTYEQAYNIFLQIFDVETPGLVVCHGIECPGVVIQAAKQKDCAVFQTNIETSTFEADALNYLSEKLAPCISIHANLLEVFSEGVLIKGDSGIGKSEVALDLIKRGHCLVADDKVEIRRIRDTLEGTAPGIIYGVMECRGVGIIDVARMFGINALKKKKRIKYCLELVKFDNNTTFDRLGNLDTYVEYLGVKIPLVKLPVSPGRSVAEVIEVAITNLKLKEAGFDTTKEFEKRLVNFQTRGLRK